MHNLKFLFLILVPSLLFLSACSGDARPGRQADPQPSREDIERALKLDLPGFVSVSSFSIEVMENMGTRVDPNWHARFYATAQLAVDTFTHDGSDSGVTFVQRVKREGDSIELFGKSVSKLFTGSWRTSFEFDAQPIRTLGEPISAFGPNQVIIRGSQAEVAYFAQKEQERLQAIEQVRLAEEFAEQERQRAEQERLQIREEARLLEERKIQDRRKMLADAPKLLIGDWQWDDTVTTFQDDGIWTVLFDNGNTGKGHWGITEDVITFSYFEWNGEPYEKANSQQFRIDFIRYESFWVVPLSGQNRDQQQTPRIR